MDHAVGSYAFRALRLVAIAVADDTIVTAIVLAPFAGSDAAAAAAAAGTTHKDEKGTSACLAACFGQKGRQPAVALDTGCDRGR